MLTAGPRGQFPKWRRSRKRLSVCSVLRCPDLWLQCGVSFVHGLEKTHHASFLNRARNSRWTVITDLDTSKRSTEKSFPCCDAILKTGPAVSMRSELLVAHEKLGHLPPLVRCARVRWEINFLLTFETAPFFCVYPVYANNSLIWDVMKNYGLSQINARIRNEICSFYGNEVMGWYEIF